MERLKDVISRFTGGEVLFIFEANPQDRHEFSTFVVRRINRSVAILERPNGDIVNMPVKNAPGKKVLVLEESSLVEETSTGWHFVN